MAVSPDDFCGGARLVLDVIGDLRDLVHQHFFRAIGDVEQHEVGPRDVAVVEQRGLQCFGDGGHGTAFAAGCAGAHDGGTAVAHHRFDVVHVDVDVSGQRDDFGDALGGGAEHFVRVGEGLLQGEVAEELAQLVVADDEQGVDGGAHLLEAFRSLRGAALAFEVERDRHDADGQDAEFLAGLGDDRRGAGARTTAHAGRDEHHRRVVVELGEDVIEVFDGGILAGLGDASSALSCGQGGAQLDAGGNGGGLQGLVVRVADDEVHAVDALLVHVVDGVGTATTHTDHLDRGAGVLGKVELHGFEFVDEGVYFGNSGVPARHG